jgi:MFS superfamily sulfate permease-like transporter
MNGFALTVIVSQLPAFFGFGVDAHEMLDESRQFALALLAGRTNLLALAIGAGTLLTILLLMRFPRLPGVLIAVAGATLVVTLQDLALRAGVSGLGALPKGLPGFAMPSMGANDTSHQRCSVHWPWR